MARGPLAGIKVLEIAGIGPGPFCAMLLSDMGADVVRVERPNAPVHNQADFTQRGRRLLAIDLKKPESTTLALALIAAADVLIEGYRPGVMERLGLGPDIALAHNPRLIYGRITGWGQFGPLSQAAGHDINYIAVTGALHAMGAANDVPRPPLNLAGDFGGGALYLAMGICAALVERAASGKGQIIDAAITDGVISLMSMIYGLRAGAIWNPAREANMLDGGAPFYGTYRCADGNFIAVGALEPHFHAQLMARLGLADDPQFARQDDPALWPRQRARLAEIFAARSRSAWSERLEGSDCCFAPVLSMAEAITHPHNEARNAFIEVAGYRQPAPAPRFSRTPGAIQGGPMPAQTTTAAVLKSWQ